MARHSRTLSAQGIYHIVLKGINSNDIFFDEKDYLSFLKYFKEACDNYNVSIIAYCLMSNHIHLILRFNNDSMSEMFKSFGARFVPKYNANHFKEGPLFNGRYYSSPINDDEYLAAALRYVHYNPVKAGLCHLPQDYKWSSYTEYTDRFEKYIDRSIIKSIFEDDGFIMLHTVSDADLDNFFFINTRINGINENELNEYINRNKNKSNEELVNLLKKANVTKLSIAKALKLDRRKL